MRCATAISSGQSSGAARSIRMAPQWVDGAERRVRSNGLSTWRWPVPGLPVETSTTSRRTAQEPRWVTRSRSRRPRPSTASERDPTSRC